MPMNEPAKNNLPTHQPAPTQAARQFVPILLLIVGLALCGWGYHEYRDANQWSEAEIKASVYLNARLQHARQQASASKNNNLQVESAEEAFARVNRELRAELTTDKENAQLWIVSGLILSILGLLPLIGRFRAYLKSR